MKSSSKYQYHSNTLEYAEQTFHQYNQGDNAKMPEAAV